MAWLWPRQMNEVISILQVPADSSFVVGKGASLESLNATVLEVARTNIPIFIVGESGTGKEVYSRLLHRLSGGAATTFRKVNCSLLEPAQLVHSAEFSQRPSTGTLFLDAIDELDSSCQRALLSLLFREEGPDGTNGAFARLISASSRDLEEDAKAGHFRKELYFRINGVCLRLPSLRDRREDIPTFLEHFLQKHAQELNKIVPKFNQDFVSALMDYDWPGNIRELENLARKMVALGNPELALSDLRVSRPDSTAPRRLEGSFSLKSAARAASRQRERELILEALERTRWNRKRAARELQISYKALLYKLKQIGSPGNESQK